MLLKNSISSATSYGAYGEAAELFHERVLCTGGIEIRLAVVTGTPVGPAYAGPQHASTEPHWCVASRSCTPHALVRPQIEKVETVIEPDVEHLVKSEVRQPRASPGIAARPPRRRSPSRSRNTSTTSGRVPDGNQSVNPSWKNASPGSITCGSSWETMSIALSQNHASAGRATSSNSWRRLNRRGPSGRSCARRQCRHHWKASLRRHTSCSSCRFHTDRDRYGRRSSSREHAYSWRWRDPTVSAYKSWIGKIVRWTASTWRWHSRARPPDLVGQRPRRRIPQER